MSTRSIILTALAVLLVAAGPALAAPLPGALGTPIPSSPGRSPSPLGPLAGLLAAGSLIVGITIRKDTGSLAKKYQQRAVAAAPDYKDGVANAGADWESNTKNAESSYEAGVQEAIGDKRFGKGVTGSAQKYQTNAVTLGSTRYAGGVQNATDAWARGVQPALDTLKSLNLPPKGPRRSPANQARANMVATALGALKRGR